MLNIMKKRLIISLGLLIGSLSACAQKNYNDTDVMGFEKLIEKDSVIVLDVRTQSEFKEGFIKGAVQIDFKDPDHLNKAKDLLNKNKHIAIYCRSGRRSSAFAYQLAAEGYRVTNLYGGILAWQQQGKTLSK